MLDGLRRWRQRRELLAKAARLDDQARNRDVALPRAIYAAGAIAGAALASRNPTPVMIAARDLAASESKRWEDDTEALRVRARELREEATALRRS